MQTCNQQHQHLRTPTQPADNSFWPGSASLVLHVVVAAAAKKACRLPAHCGPLWSPATAATVTPGGQDYVTIANKRVFKELEPQGA